MPGKKGKLTDYLEGLPEGSRVERLPTQIFEPQPAEQVEMDPMLLTDYPGEAPDPEARTKQRDELFANRAAARKIAKRDALFQARDADRNRPTGSMNPMQEMSPSAFNKLHERKPTAPRISPNRIPYTEAGGFRTGVPKHRTITRSDGSKVVIPNYGPLMMEAAEEEQPGVLDDILALTRD